MKLPKSGDGTGDSMLPVPSPLQRVKSADLFFPLSYPHAPGQRPFPNCGITAPYRLILVTIHSAPPTYCTQGVAAR